jgi:hypothetical protein
MKLRERESALRPAPVRLSPPLRRLIAILMGAVIIWLLWRIDLLWLITFVAFKRADAPRPGPPI